MTSTISATSDPISALIATFANSLRDPAQPLALIVEFQVKDGAQEEVERAFAEASVSTAEEDGVAVFQLHRAHSAPARFVVYEQWRSLVDLDAHLRTPYITALRAAIDRVIVGDPSFRVLMLA